MHFVWIDFISTTIFRTCSITLRYTYFKNTFRYYISPQIYLPRDVSCEELTDDCPIECKRCGEVRKWNGKEDASGSEGTYVKM